MNSYPVFRTRLLTLASLLAIAAFTLFARPYEGLQHDGVLYLGQVLLHSRVPTLRLDTFFAGGSQDSYSVYSYLMLPLYTHLGMLPTHIGVLLVGWLASLGAVLALLWRFQPGGSLPYWGMVAFAVMSPVYGGTYVIGYSEPFVTARTLVEPTLLWSLVALLDGRRLLSASLLIFAALLHPLLTLPVMGICWLYAVQTNHRWLWLLTVVPLAILAALAGVAPWDGLIKTYDPYWWAMVHNANRMVELAEWTISERLRVVLDVAILVWCSRLHPEAGWKRLLLAVAVVTTVAIILTGVGTDLLQVVLLTQLQLWRAHWVAHLLAMTLAPWLAVQLYRCGGFWQASAVAMALAVLNSHTNQIHGGVTIALWALVSLCAWRLPNVSTTVVRFASGVMVLCMLALSFIHVAIYVEQWSWTFPLTAVTDGIAKIASSPLVAFALFAGLMFMVRRGPLGSAAAVGFGALLLVVAGLAWDQRPDLARAVESEAATPHPFATYIPPEAQVYWPNQLIPVWSMLERPSHYASQQGAGLLFNRGTAVMFGPRKEMYRRIKADYDNCHAGGLMLKSRSAWFGCEMPSLDRLTDLCNQVDAPEFLVLAGRVSAAPLASWQPPSYRNAPQAYNLYACSQLKTASG